MRTSTKHAGQFRFLALWAFKRRADQPRLWNKLWKFEKFTTGPGTVCGSFEAEHELKRFGAIDCQHWRGQTNRLAVDELQIIRLRWTYHLLGSCSYDLLPF